MPEEARLYKPIYLNFCKNLDVETSKTFHHSLDSSSMEEILNLASLKDLNELEHKALLEILKKHENSIYIRGDNWHRVNESLEYHRNYLKTDE